ncbi:MAG: hypothetical protein KDC67_12200 [Ignavibacteriae bacterium]|nr:hypothetical protein [Ignavibacteriota bacterium]
MAQIKNNVLGNPSGKLGQLVFRTLNGKTFVSVRTKKYKATKSKLAKVVRNGFKENNLLASTINKNEMLKLIWQSAKIDARSAYTKILKTNLKLSLNNGVTISNVLVPKSNLSIESSITFLDNGELKICINKKSIDKFLKSKSELNCFACFFFTEPTGKNRKPFQAELLTSNVFESDKNNVAFFYKSVTNKSYKKAIVFSSLVITKESKISKWSSTNVKEFQF